MVLESGHSIGEFYNDVTWVYEAIAWGTKARLDTSSPFLAAADRGRYLVSWAIPLAENHPVWAFIETYKEDE